MSSSRPEGQAAATGRLAAVCVLGLLVVVGAAWTLARGETRLMPATLRDLTPATCAGLGLLAAGWFLPPRVGHLSAAAGAAIVALAASGAIADGADTRASGTGPALMAVLVTALAAARVLPLRAARGCAALAAVGSGAALLGGVLAERAAGSPPLAAAVLLLSCAMLADEPDGIAGWIAEGTDAGAHALRRTLPAAFAATVALGAGVGVTARVWGVDAATAVAVTTSTAAAVVAAVTVRFARELRRSETERGWAVAATEAMTRDHVRRVQESAAELEAHRTRAAVLVDRERIAGQINDLVVQRLFAVALDMQTRAEDSGGVVDVDAALDGLDDAIRDLRRSVFGLQTAPLLDLAAELRDLGAARGALTEDVALNIAGPLDQVPYEVAVNLLAAAREAVSNAVRHAAPTSLAVDVEVGEDAVTLTVADDGGGITEAAAEELRRARDRAVQFGGSCVWHEQPHGTVLVWSVPLRASAGPVAETMNERIVAAMHEVTRALVDDPAADRLSVGALALRAPVTADTAALLVPDRAGRLRVAATEGFAPDADPAGTLVEREETLAARAILTGRPIRVDEAAPGASVRSASPAPAGPALVLPLRGPSVAHGALVLGRSAGRAPFGQAEEDAAALLVAHLAAVLELAPRPEHIEAWPRADFDYRSLSRT